MGVSTQQSRWALHAGSRGPLTSRLIGSCMALCSMHTCTHRGAASCVAADHDGCVVHADQPPRVRNPAVQQRVRARVAAVGAALGSWAAVARHAHGCAGNKGIGRAEVPWLAAQQQRGGCSTRVRNDISRLAAERAHTAWRKATAQTALLAAAALPGCMHGARCARSPRCAA